MIEVLLGSKNAERVLLYIFTREEGYAREIATFYTTDLKPIQMQLEKFEKAEFSSAAPSGGLDPMNSIRVTPS